ncbi:hypothetical protein CPB83DRAFT_598223 [Crepidotus variabilis]|uniref:F-box domain-containing protein n=1 Tax=Crepidotus variabilis TaxID=179855 RepID=A0A9P6E914_9AGAR|nr:hypothetical protein CPB83DRAFT_598223 [Crepidotus variabilis]
MPLDIQFEIFSNLSPKDLLNVTRITKALRKTLTSKSATTVWKASREATLTPRCPPWFSEPAWAAFLYGNICEICGGKNISKIEIALFKRVCAGCKRKNLITWRRFLSSHPGLDVRILELVPYVKDAESRKFYWEPDLGKLVIIEAEFQKQIKRGSTEAKAALDDFRVDHLDRREYIQTHRNRLKGWRWRYFDERKVELAARRERHRDQIEQRLLNLGHVSMDLQFLQSLPSANKSHDLGSKEWHKIQPELTVMAVQAREARLEREASEFRRNRFSAISSRYLAFKRGMHPSKWKYLPPIKSLVALEPFVACITAEKSSTISPPELNELFLKLPEFLAQIERKQILRLLNILQPALDPPAWSMDKILLHTIPVCVELASSVFRCVEGDYMFGYDEVASHHCGVGVGSFQPRATEAKFIAASERRRQTFYDPPILGAGTAAAVVDKILRLVGLDPASATVSDLDECVNKDDAPLRFECDGCAAVKDNTLFYKLGYDWRTLAIHLDMAHMAAEDHNPLLTFRQLTAGPAQLIKSVELQRNLTRGVWACTHCTDHVNQLQTRENVLQHVVKFHAILNPIENVDFVVADATPLRGRQSAKYYVEPSTLSTIPSDNATNDARCCHCGEKSRIFILLGVKDHLRARHDVVSPQVGEDYEFVVFK